MVLLRKKNAMPIIERISKWMAERRSSDVTVTPFAGGSARIPSFGVSVNNGNALNITALYAGIRIISENIAAFPKNVKRETKEGWVNDKDHPAFGLIDHKPNPYTNKFDFWNCIVTWLVGWGNAYAIIKWGPGGVPKALYQVHPACVRVKLVEGKKWYQVQITTQGLTWLNGTYSDDDMLHFMLLTLDGIKGENPIVRNAMALSKNLAQEKFASEFYERGGQVKGVMEMDSHLGDDEYMTFMNHFGNVGGNFDTPLLEYGIKYKQLSIDPVAAQLIQSETFSVQDVARILNLPPHLLAELSHATYSNIEEQNIQFVQLSLRPTVKRLEVELESKLFVGTEANEYSVKFNLDGLMRGNTKDRAAFYHNAILDGYMSRNEVRGLEGLTNLDGLDILLYPQNESIVSNDSEANEVLLAERLGVGGTQSLVSILQDPALSDEQKKAMLKLLFGFTDEELDSLFPGGNKDKPKDEQEDNK